MTSNLPCSWIAAGSGLKLMAEERLPAVRSIAKDSVTGNIGEIMDYEPTGAPDPSTAVLRPEGGGLEWRTPVRALIPLPGWPPGRALRRGQG